MTIWLYLSEYLLNKCSVKMICALNDLYSMNVPLVHIHCRYTDVYIRVGGGRWRVEGGGWLVGG